MLHNKNSFKLLNFNIATILLVLTLIIIIHKPTNYSIENLLGIKIKQISYNLSITINQFFTKILEKKPDQSNVIIDLKNTINNLELENANLKNLLLQKQTIEYENVELKKFLNFIAEKKFKTTVTALITSNTTSSINNNILISAGYTNYITNNNLVINNVGLVGYIENSYKHYSSVILLTNKDFRIAAKTKDSNYNVVVFGNNTPLLDINAYTEKYVFVEGEMVYTSGLENKYPSNLPIGYIVKTKNGFKVIPYYNLNNANRYVYIITDNTK